MQEAEIYTLFGKANTVKSWNVVRINDIAHQSRAYSVLKKHEFTAGVTPVCFQQSNDKGGPIASADKFRKGEIVHGVIGYLDSRGGKPQFDPVAHFPYLDSVLMKNCEKNLGDLKSLVLTVPSTQSKATLLDPSGNPFGDEERYPQRSAGFASILVRSYVYYLQIPLLEFGFVTFPLFDVTLHPSAAIHRHTASQGLPTERRRLCCAIPSIMVLRSRL